MNTPLLLTSVALLAGVAARPIENDRGADDLRELPRSPDIHDRQSFLGRVPSSFSSLNSLPLDGIHGHTGQDNNALIGSTSPKLTGVQDSSLAQPDPGLASPYIGPQRHLSNLEQELGSPAALSPDSPTPPASRKPEQQRRLPLEEADYSPMVVVLVFSSLAALVLLGVTIAVVYASRLLRRTMMQEHVWKSVVSAHGGEKRDVNGSEMEKEVQGEKGIILEGGMDRAVIVTREMPLERSSGFNTDPAKIWESSVEDPEVPSLPGRGSPTPLSAPALSEQSHKRHMGLALAAWTYDNWVTHFMMAFFGWLGVFFGGARSTA